MNNKGFGFIEILIVLVILCALGFAAFKKYSGKTQEVVKSVPAQIQQSKELEGKIFIANVVNAEKTYYALNGKYVYTAWTKSSPDLGIDTSANAYFKEFCVEKTADGGFAVKTKGSGEMEGVTLTS